MGKIGKRTGLGIAVLALAVALAVPATAPAATTVIGKVSLSAGTPPNGSSTASAAHTATTHITRTPNLLDRPRFMNP